MNNDHFNGKYEVEFKFKLRSKADFLSVLATIPHDIMFEDNVETDWFYDFPCGALASENKSLSIREMTPSGIKLWIVKGPEADRCEATNITDANVARSMLTTMGYQHVLTASKIRSVYFVGEFHITLDYLDGIGHFAEFAVTTNDDSAFARYRTELMALAARFGLTPAEIEPMSYRQMFAQRG
uniref:class IV adenylate cyclase n=1 Tax=Thaumasiovibrio occultus TaxID=1891184 RepID=UPI000B350A10|nr:class IV adenylate cyclase [Thaumasiovibrio occultus]